jgi:hypothetical protein
MLSAAYGQVNSWNRGNGERKFVQDKRKHEQIASNIVTMSQQH